MVDNSIGKPLSVGVPWEQVSHSVHVNPTFDDEGNMLTRGWSGTQQQWAEKIRHEEIMEKLGAIESLLREKK